MKTLCFPLLLVFASVLLSGCGIIGHNLGRLGNSIPNLSSLTNLLKIENETGTAQPVRIEGGNLQALGTDE